MPGIEIEIIRGTVVGGLAVEPGQVVAASASEADLLIRLGKARPAQVDVETASAEPDAEAAVMPTAKRKRG